MTRPTNKNNWQTPRWLIDILQGYRPITLDPCTTTDNPVGAKTYFTPEYDGLSCRWNLDKDSVVFMNPPFGVGKMAKWSSKFLEEFKAAHYLPEGWVLCKMDSTKATKRLLTACDFMCVFHKRVNYEVGGVEQKGADFPSMLLYFGTKGNYAASYIRKFGMCSAFTSEGYYD